eukprot:4096366-Alexandrium_andersonii.AAC.1
MQFRAQAVLRTAYVDRCNVIASAQRQERLPESRSCVQDGGSVVCVWGGLVLMPLRVDTCSYVHH